MWEGLEVLIVTFPTVMIYLLLECEHLARYSSLPFFWSASILLAIPLKAINKNSKLLV